MKKTLLFISFYICFCEFTHGQVVDGINAGQFGLNEHQDATPAILKALDACYESGASRLIIPKGTYQFYPDYALEEYLAITGVSNGLRRIAFPLINFENLIIDGSGSTLIFHGDMLPFEIQESKNIRIRNMTIRFSWASGGMAKVTALNKAAGTYELEVNPGDSLCIYNGLLTLKKEGDFIPLKSVGWFAEKSNIDSCQFYPAQTNSMVAKNELHARKKDNNHFLVYASGKVFPSKGWKLIWRLADKQWEENFSPAFHASGSNGITLSNVTVSQIPCSAVIAEQCGNIMLDRFDILPVNKLGKNFIPEPKGVLFAGCQKQLVLNSCHFYGITGDAVTVKGPELKVVKLLDANALGVLQMNVRQWGSPFAQVGDTVRFVNPDNGSEREEATVTRIRDLNEQYQEISFNHLFPGRIKAGVILVNLSHQPEIVVRNSTFKEVMGNGLRLSTAGRISINGNTIQSGASAVLLGGELETAYEPVQLNQVLIKDNIIKSCRTHFAKNPSQIIVDSHLPGIVSDTAFFHRDITIENNTFYNKGESILNASLATDLIVRKNTISTSDSDSLMRAPIIQLRHCKKVGIVANRFLNKHQATMKIEQVEDLLFFNNEGITPN